MVQKPLRCAIIGCGCIHHEHARALLELPGAELVAVCDNKRERADASAARYGARAEYDAGAVLTAPDIDVVHLCTPHYLHAPMAMEAMRAGKFVLTEKPMATGDDDARAMAQLSRSLGGRLGVVFQNRYLPAARMLRRIIRDGEMGALLGIRGAVAWCRTPAYYSDDWHGRWATEGGGVMMNQAIHTLDLLQWCVGRRVVRVDGSISTDALGAVMEVEDTAHIRLAFEDGTVGLFYATVAGNDNEPVELHVRLEGGRLLYRGGFLYRWEDDGRLSLLRGLDEKAQGDKAYWGTGHQAQLEDFYDSLLQGKPIEIDGEEGYQALRIVQALYRAARTGSSQSLELGRV